MNRNATFIILLLAASVMSVLIGCEFLQPPPESQTATLKVTINGGGTVVADPKPDQNGLYQKGASVKLTAVGTQGIMFYNFMGSIQGTSGKDLLNGWSFSKWGGDSSGTQATMTIVMDGDKNVTATFAHTGIKKITSSPANINTGVASTTLTYDSTGKLTRTDDFDSSNAQIYYSIYEYNSSGQCTQFTLYNPDGSIYSGSMWGLWALVKYYYSSSGVATKTEYYDSTPSLRYYLESDFNSAGQAVTITWFDVQANRAGMVIHVYYDDLGRMLTLEVYNDDGSGLTYGGYYAMAYDANGVFTKVDIYDSNDVLSQSMTVSYDAAGTPIDMKWYISGALQTTYDFLWQNL